MLVPGSVCALVWLPFEAPGPSVLGVAPWHLQRFGTSCLDDLRPVCLRPMLPVKERCQCQWMGFLREIRGFNPGYSPPK